MKPTTIVTRTALLACLALTACRDDGQHAVLGPPLLSTTDDGTGGTPGDGRRVAEQDLSDAGDNSTAGIIGRLQSVDRVVDVLGARMEAIHGVFSPPPEDTKPAFIDVLDAIVARAAYLRDHAAFLEAAFCGEAAERPAPIASTDGEVADPDAEDSDDTSFEGLFGRLVSVKDVLAALDKRVDDVADATHPPDPVQPPDPSLCAPEVLGPLAAIQAGAQGVIDLAEAMLEVLAPNQPPTSAITSPSGDITVSLGDAVDFQGTASDPDGMVASHAWSFGDGSGAAVEDPGEHTYAGTGAYTVSYFVTDDDGATSEPDTVVVTVEEPPSFSASSVQLDGVDDVVDVATAHEIVTSEAFSLSIWFRATVAGEAHLIGKQNPGALRRGYFIHTDGSGNVCFSLVANENSLRQRECTTSPPALGEWHHVVATVAQGARSFAAARIYVDGVEATTNAIGENMENNSVSNTGANFTIGAAVCSGSCTTTGGSDGDPVPLSRALQGWVDEAAIYRGVELTAAQVSEIYNGGSPPDLMALSMTPQPNSWWRMGECTDGSMTLVCDEGTGTVINGILTSAPGTLLNGAFFSTEVP